MFQKRLNRQKIKYKIKELLTLLMSPSIELDMLIFNWKHQTKKMHKRMISKNN